MVTATKILLPIMAGVIFFFIALSLPKETQVLTSESVETATDLPFIRNLDFWDYQGVWYEIASKPSLVEKKCKCAQVADSAYYSGSGFWHQHSCIIEGKNITTRSTLIADSPGLGNFTHHNDLESTPYWVIEIDYLYRWQVVGRPDRLGYWIFSRMKSLDKEIIEYLNKKWETMGFNLKDLAYMDQSCNN